MEICNKQNCTGCLACLDVCKKEAIRCIHNEQGFMYPVVDDNLCVGCNQCKKVCPANNPVKNAKTDYIYAAWNKNNVTRLQATSGGVFLLLARQIIIQGGVVYGAAFDENFRVKHKRVDNVEGLKKLSGSKYVQSDTKGIFEKVKGDLVSGKAVLFSGTPCQVSALKSFLGKEYTNLICIDLVCHGVPSPLVFRDYLNELSTKYESEPAIINFRHKEPCWSVFSMRIMFRNGEVYQASKFRDPYLYFFLAGGGGDLTLRQSCFNCKFTSPERTGDITLGDFWRICSENKAQKDIEKGVNVVLLNSEKGKSLFEKISDDVVTIKKCWEDAHGSNQSFAEPFKKPAMYEEFWTDYVSSSFSEIVDKYYIYDSETEALKCQQAEERAMAYKNIPYIIKKKIKSIIKRIAR